jgi:hypothetical protein
MKRESFFFAVALFLITCGLLAATLRYPARSRTFPLIVLFTAFVLIAVQIYREAPALRKKIPPAGKAGSLAIWCWLAFTLLMLWLLGFMGTVILLPFLYLRFHKESWTISIALPAGCGVFFYSLFALALGMPLYPGILFPELFG